MDRRSEILQTAGQLFRESGYHATSMRDIASKLELRGSSLYTHISSKEELLWEIVNHAADTFMAQAQACISIDDPLARLDALLRGHLEVIMQELPRATVFFHDWKFLSADLRSQIVARRDAYEAYFRQAIRDGVAAGCLHVDDSELATLFVLSSLNWSYQWLQSEGRLPFDTLSQRYSHFILRGLGGSPV